MALLDAGPGENVLVLADIDESQLEEGIYRADGELRSDLPDPAPEHRRYSARRYAHGNHRDLGNRGSVEIAGNRHPGRGKITLGRTMIDYVSWATLGTEP